MAGLFIHILLSFMVHVGIYTYIFYLYCTWILCDIYLYIYIYLWKHIATYSSGSRKCRWSMVRLPPKKMSREMIKSLQVQPVAKDTPETKMILDKKNHAQYGGFQK